MSKFKPQVMYITKESLNTHLNAGYWVKPTPSKYITKEYKTYGELKKDLKGICESNIDSDGVHVVRSLRGQWGEWNERWELDDKGIPRIVYQGWS